MWIGWPRSAAASSTAATRSTYSSALRVGGRNTHSLPSLGSTVSAVRTKGPAPVNGWPGPTAASAGPPSRVWRLAASARTRAQNAA